jgi:hypothetical protein
MSYIEDGAHTETFDDENVLFMLVCDHCFVLERDEDRHPFQAFPSFPPAPATSDSRQREWIEVVVRE